MRAHTHTRCKKIPEVFSFRDDKNRDGSQKGGLLATEATDMNASPRKLH